MSSVKVYDIELGKLADEVLDGVDVCRYIKENVDMLPGYLSHFPSVTEEKIGVLKANIDNFYTCSRKEGKLYLIDGFLRLIHLRKTHAEHKVWVREYAELSDIEWVEVLGNCTSCKYESKGVSRWMDGGFALAVHQRMGVDLNKVLTPVAYTLGSNGVPLYVRDVASQYVLGEGSSSDVRANTSLFGAPAYAYKGYKSRGVFVLANLKVVKNKMFFSDIQKLASLYDLEATFNVANVKEKREEFRRLNGYYMFLEFLTYTLGLIRTLEVDQKIEAQEMSLDILHTYFKRVDILKWVKSLETNTETTRRLKIKKNAVELLDLMLLATGSEVCREDIFLLG